MGRVYCNYTLQLCCRQTAQQSLHTTHNTVEKTSLFGVNSMKSQVLYRAAQAQHCIVFEIPFFIVKYTCMKVMYTYTWG